MLTDWKSLSPVQFEKVCTVILKANEFTNVQWLGEAGNDKGRDILAEMVDQPLPGLVRKEKWMIQCKRYTRATLSKTELKELLDAALEHPVDYLLIITLSTVSANLHDWLNTVSEKYPFKVFLWQEMEFRRQVLEHKNEILDLMPELLENKEPLGLYKRHSNEIHFGCNEFEEVEIVVVNEDSVEKAQEKAAEFLKYIRSNGFDWWN